MTAPTAPSPRSGTGLPGSPDLLRSVFRRHAAGVAVITADNGGRPVGFTATSLNSVSADPPLLSFTIGTGSSSWPGVRDSEYLGVHILGEHQSDLAGLFARNGADRFGPATDWAPGPYGVPVLDGVLAWLVCRIVARVPAGAHRVVIAEAVAGDPAGDLAGEGRPLLYHQGRFNALRD
ncbi:flavin reductase family protein [Streptomyces sp. NBC_00503]|uniref:flavin reductase family protein n=1 Tax=Streptomyces sp. NBC_00503 TaxID=2903659 RepID=UPI002E810538|nr:flavin reductase family protein [Streptomyces sp. NBC_00503]WUD79967.1 flavin reductase family protein [Streptomyces sp. NBC_00503]